MTNRKPTVVVHRNVERPIRPAISLPFVQILTFRFAARISVAVDGTGKFAYVVSSGSNNISVYSIDAATGALPLVATIGT